jgi:hypothetical protein
VSAVALLAVGASAFAPPLVPVPIGRGPAFQPAPGARGACRAWSRPRVTAHIELFAHGFVVIVPAGIGVRAPRRDGAFVVAGRCHGPVWTLEPTGLVHAVDERRTLGDLFAVWGRRLGPRRLLGFGGGAVRAFVGGVRWRGDPWRIPLRHHAQIVVELGAYVPPHVRYLFPPGR